MPSIVGVCPVCGGRVIAASEHVKKIYCSGVCQRKAERQRRQDGVKIEKPMRLKRVRKLRAQEHAEMHARLRALDEEYAKVAPATTRVEVRGGVRIETRGRAVIGAMAVGMVRHS